MAHAIETYNTKDLTMLSMCMGKRNVGHCLQEIVMIDMITIGCIASEVVLYLFRLHYRCCYHSFRHGHHISMVLCVEVLGRDLGAVPGTFRRI